MNSTSHPVTVRHMFKPERGQSSVTTVTHPYKGVTVVTVTHANETTMADLVPMPLARVAMDAI